MADKNWNAQTIASVFSQRKAKPIHDLRYFAVLALLTERNGELCFVLNKRAPRINQGGDICFPGGQREKDERLRETALRETEEELGVSRKDICLLGKSDYLLTHARGYIQPYVGYVPYLRLRESLINCDEVSEVFTVPLSFFMDTPPEIHHLHWEVKDSNAFPYERIEGGKNYPFYRNRVSQPFYSYKNHTIWGLTAQIIQNITKTLQAEMGPTNNQQ